MSMFVDKARATGNPTKNWADMEEDNDEKTVTSGGSEKNNQKMKEISVKRCFNGMTDNKAVKWDIATLGFLQGYNVMHVSKHHA